MSRIISYIFMKVTLHAIIQVQRTIENIEEEICAQKYTRPMATANRTKLFPCPINQSSGPL